MPAALLTPPAAEPVSLAELKAHLRIEGDAEDATLARLVAAARAHVEQATRRVLVAQVWRIYLDRWPRSRRVTLPVTPVRAVLAVTVYDALGSAASVPTSGLVLDTARAPPTLVPPAGAPFPGRATNGIEIDVAAGYGTPEAVPAPLREAVLRLSARWFEHRLDAEATQLAGTPPLVEALIAPYRVLW